MRVGLVVLAVAAVGLLAVLWARPWGDDGEAGREAESVQPAEVTPAVEAEIQRWVDRLKAGDEGGLFREHLGRWPEKSEETVPFLIATLKVHRDFYARLGAATALGELRAADAVPSLIDALDDEDDLVRTAAAEALRRITGRDVEFEPGLVKERRVEIQGDWRAWWHPNEATVRDRLDRER